MRLGKVSESVLKRSVLKEIKYHNEEVILGAGVSADCGAVRIPEGHILVTSTDPITCASVNIPILAVHNGLNDILVTGASPIGIMLTVLMPVSFMESELKEMMAEFNSICQEMHIQILGGHTETTSAVTRPVVSITTIGSVLEDEYLDVRSLKPDQDIIMTKGIGIEGTAILAWEQGELLSKRFSPSFMRKCRDFINRISIAKECGIGKQWGVTAMHDVSEGGLFGALWELASGANMGISINLKDILIQQETIELCEIFDINPYYLVSGGTVLMVTDHGKELTEALNSEGIPAAIIGKVTAGKERVVINGEERRFLEPPKSDELQLFEARNFNRK